MHSEAEAEADVAPTEAVTAVYSAEAAGGGARASGVDDVDGAYVTEAEAVAPEAVAPEAVATALDIVPPVQTVVASRNSPGPIHNRTVSNSLAPCVADNTRLQTGIHRGSYSPLLKYFTFFFTSPRAHASAPSILLYSQHAISWSILVGRAYKQRIRLLHLSHTPGADDSLTSHSPFATSIHASPIMRNTVIASSIDTPLLLFTRSSHSRWMLRNAPVTGRKLQIGSVWCDFLTLCTCTPAFVASRYVLVPNSLPSLVGNTSFFSKYSTPSTCERSCSERLTSSTFKWPQPRTYVATRTCHTVFLACPINHVLRRSSCSLPHYEMGPTPARAPMKQSRPSRR